MTTLDPVTLELLVELFRVPIILLALFELHLVRLLSIGKLFASQLFFDGLLLIGFVFADF